MRSCDEFRHCLCAEWSVRELLDAAYPYRLDLDEDDAAFLERLRRWPAKDLKVRQINRLASLVRLTEFLPRDETVANLTLTSSTDAPASASDAREFGDYQRRP